MKKNNMIKIFAVILMVMLIVAVLPTTMTTFAEMTAEENEIEVATVEIAEEVTVETTEEVTVETTEEVTVETTEETAEEATEETTEEATEEVTVEVTEEATEEITEEVIEEATEEITEEVIEEAVIEEEILVAETPEAELTTYNVVYLSGLNVQNSDWEKIEITVSNVKTGETQQGFMNYQSDHELLGYLTSGDCADTNATYQIEAQVYTADGNVTVVNGCSVGMVGNGSDYSVMSFQADHNATI